MPIFAVNIFPKTVNDHPLIKKETPIGVSFFINTFMSLVFKDQTSTFWPEQKT